MKPRRRRTGGNGDGYNASENSAWITLAVLIGITLAVGVGIYLMVGSGGSGSGSGSGSGGSGGSGGLHLSDTQPKEAADCKTCSNKYCPLNTGPKTTWKWHNYCFKIGTKDKRCACINKGMSKEMFKKNNGGMHYVPSEADFLKDPLKMYPQ